MKQLRSKYPNAPKRYVVSEKEIRKIIDIAIEGTIKKLLT